MFLVGNNTTDNVLVVFPSVGDVIMTSERFLATIVTPEDDIVPHCLDSSSSLWRRSAPKRRCVRHEAKLGAHARITHWHHTQLLHQCRITSHYCHISISSYVASRSYDITVIKMGVLQCQMMWITLGDALHFQSCKISYQRKSVNLPTLLVTLFYFSCLIMETSRFSILSMLYLKMCLF